MNIELDGPVSSANATLIRQVLEALIQRIVARDGDLDLSALDRVVVADDLAAAEARFGVTPAAGEHLSRIVDSNPGFALLVNGIKLW